jgi:pyruvate formate lyase activating enzyme
MRQAAIFDIQRFSIHDGPGIRTTLFFKGCPLRCAWCQNPESHKPGPEIAFYNQHCSGCFTCKDVCKENAVLDGADRRIDYSRCTVCGKCVTSCPSSSLKMVGAWWNTYLLLEEIKKDADFFSDSGGGITLSGGEPGMQVEFLEQFLPVVKARGFHVNMETCGLFHWQEMKLLLPYLDLLYYDLKIMDPARHKTFTGGDNRIILEHFRKLAAVFPNLQARMPVIPSINDDSENITAVAAFLKENGKWSIHLLKYHRLGEAKLPTIETELQPLGLTQDTTFSLSTAASLFEKEGIEALVIE